MSSLFIHQNISVGASGALFGLLGAMLSELLTKWAIYSNKIAALLTLVVIIAANLAVGILPHVDNFAHIGGFLTGLLLGFSMLIRPQFGSYESRNLPDARVKSRHEPYQYGLLLLIAGLVLMLPLPNYGDVFNGYPLNAICVLPNDESAISFFPIAFHCSFTVGLVMMYRGVNRNDKCSWCHYISCVPTSNWKCHKS